MNYPSGSVYEAARNDVEDSKPCWGCGNKAATKLFCVQVDDFGQEWAAYCDGCHDKAEGDRKEAWKDQAREREARKPLTYKLGDVLRKARAA